MKDLNPTPFPQIPLLLIKAQLLFNESFNQKIKIGLTKWIILSSLLKKIWKNIYYSEIHYLL